MNDATIQITLDTALRSLDSATWYVLEAGRWLRKRPPDPTRSLHLVGHGRAKLADVTDLLQAVSRGGL